jgi:hypothetical protein
LIDQRDKAKAAWSIVVLLSGLLGYQLTLNQSTTQPEIQSESVCPHCQGGIYYGTNNSFEK